MRRFDKTKNIRKANLLAEQRYLESKGLIKENEENKKKKNKTEPVIAMLVLDGESRTKLLNAVGHLIPEGWKTIAHHMTIPYGKGLPENLKDDLGSVQTIEVTETGLSDKAMAVKVKGYPAFEYDGITPKKIPHVTVAIPQGGAAVNSNNIEDWEVFEHPKDKLDGKEEKLELSGEIVQGKVKDLFRSGD